MAGGRVDACVDARVVASTPRGGRVDAAEGFDASNASTPLLGAERC